MAACNLNLTGIAFSCTDLPVGGLTKIYIGERSDVISATAGNVTVDDDKTSANYGDVTIGAATGLVTDAGLVELSFNNKDAFSVFTDVKTVSADGVTSTVPTIAVEVPTMSAAHRDALNELASAGAELVAFVETAAGTYHMVGFDYGLYAATVDGTSGTGRSEKNRFQITLTGDEDSLALALTAEQWADVTDSVA